MKHQFQKWLIIIALIIAFAYGGTTWYRTGFSSTLVFNWISLTWICIGWLHVLDSQANHPEVKESANQFIRLILLIYLWPLRYFSKKYREWNGE